MKSIHTLWLGAFIGVVGLFLSVFLNNFKASYGLVIVGFLIKGYAIYLVKNE